MKVPFYQARETAIRAYATKGKQRKGVSPKPNKPKGKSGIVPGQIGEAKFSFYAPFFHEKLHSKFTLSQIEDMISKTQLYHDSLIRNHGVKDGTSR